MSDFLGRCYYFFDRVIGVHQGPADFYMVAHKTKSGKFKRNFHFHLCNDIREVQSELDNFARKYDLRVFIEKGACKDGTA